MMGHSFGGAGWLIGLAIWFLAVGWPIAKILQRMGFSGFWTILSFIPVANVVGLWLVAVTPWPRLDEPKSPPV